MSLARRLVFGLFALGSFALRPASVRGAVAVEPALVERRLALSVDYLAPAGCPDRAEFLGELQELAPRAHPNAEHLDVEVVVEPRSASGFVARLRLPSGERRIVGAACRDVVRASALSLSLVLDDPVERGREVELLVEREPVRPTPQADPGPADSNGPPSVNHAWVFFLAGSGGIDAGTLPSVAPLATVAAGAERGRFSLALRVVGSPLASFEVEGAERATLGFVTGGLVGCGQPLRQRWVALEGCLGLDAGVLAAEAPSLSVPNSGSAVLVSSALGARVRLFVDPSWSLDLGFAWSLPLSRPRIFFATDTEPRLVHESDSAFQLQLGVSWAAR